ncbi:enoyl-CoA hydratase/isomerase family protein [Leptospira sp. 96542]|nr:enoyl-CoA hydratase/isomerase family protein [Leptospira sp. 96542]
MIDYKLEDSVGIISLKINDKNSFGHESFLKLQTILKEVKENLPNILVLRSEIADNFSAGLDLTSVSQLKTEKELLDFLGLFYQNLEDLYTLPIPTIAEVNGHALGYGAMLALACDFRLGVPNLRFGLPEVKIGIRVPAFIIALLSDSIGMDNAKWHVLLGDAEKAKDIRSLFYDLPDTAEDLAKKTKSLVTKLKRNSSDAMKETKKAVLLTKQSILKLIETDKEETIRSISSPHAKEGIAATVEVRRPNFT